jgi:cytochrome P450
MSADTQVARQLPPGPDSPFDINTTEEAFLKIPELLAQYGNLVRVPSPQRESDSYLVNDPEYIRHILVKNHANYNKGPGFSRVKMLLGNGIIVSDGAFWRRQRRMIQPAFNRRVIAVLSQQIAQCNRELFEQWSAKADNNETIDITEAAAELSLLVILRVLFSEDLDRLFDEQGDNPFAFLTQDLTRDMKVVLRFRSLTKIMQALIDWRREVQPKRFDFLAMFMEARDKETGEAMTDKELMDELMTLIIAGHETSAITLNWSWYFIANHPDVEQRALAEVESIYSTGTPDFDDLTNMNYIRQLVSEALRHYPPVWLFSRTAIGDDKLGDYDVPAGTDIFISPYYIHRHPDYWPDADRFDPERFTSEAEKTRPATAYIPFSAGPRRCIGDFFAMVEMQIHFSMMLPAFHMEYLDETPLELEPFINLRTKHGLRYRISNR